MVLGIKNERGHQLLINDNAKTMTSYCTSIYIYIYYMVMKALVIKNLYRPEILNGATRLSRQKNQETFG